MWEKDKEEYRRVYFRGERQYENGAMKYGSLIADAHETGECTGDPLIDLTLSGVPRYEHNNKEFIVDVVYQKGTVPVLFKPDSITGKMDKLIELKTGTSKWTQKKADEHGQITLYCLGVHVLTGEIPTADLVYAPTIKNAFGDRELTGEIFTFRTERKLTDLLRMKKRIHDAWVGIGEMAKEELL